MSSLTNTKRKLLEDQPDDQGRLIDHYIRFVLQEKGDPIRERLHRGLVELALKTDNSSHAMTAEDVQTRIARSTNLPTYPIGLVTRGLNQLVQRGDVKALGATNKGRHLYRLAPARFRAVEKGLATGDCQDKGFRDSIVKRLEQRHGHLSREDQDLVGAAFASFVGRMLGSLGERCAHRLLEERSGQQLSYPSIQDDLQAAVRGLPTQLQSDACQAFEEALHQPSESEAAYLYFAGQVYYIAELLNVDPELQQLQRVRFEETTLFLDTNLLLSLVHENDEAHHAVKRMASLCKAIGFKLVYASRTAEEFDALVTAADHEFRTTPAFDIEKASSFAPLVENPILRGWLESFIDHRASWHQYKARIGAWRDVLEQLEIESLSLSSAPRNEEFHALSKLLSGERHSRGGERRRPKRPRAVEHDAELVTSIETLISSDDAKPDPFGPRYWLITRDRHLVDRARSRQHSKPCVAMLADEWIQYIAPFLSPDTSNFDPATTFAELISSRFMPSLGGRMSLSDLRLFAEPKVAELTAGLSREEACRAISKAHLDAVSRGPIPERDDEIAVERLAELVERKLNRQVKTGQLVKAEEVDRIRRARESDAHRYSDSANEREQHIAALEEELTAVRKDQRTSISYAARTLVRKYHLFARKLRAWVSNHPIRATTALLLVLAAIGLWASGLGGILGLVGGIFLVLASAASVDPQQLRRNMATLLGSRDTPESDSE